MWPLFEKLVLSLLTANLILSLSSNDSWMDAFYPIDIFLFINKNDKVERKTLCTASGWWVERNGSVSTTLDLEI